MSKPEHFRRLGPEKNCSVCRFAKGVRTDPDDSVSIVATCTKHQFQLPSRTMEQAKYVCNDYLHWRLSEEGADF
jgi:hypothetical protein